MNVSLSWSGGSFWCPSIAPPHNSRSTQKTRQGGSESLEKSDSLLVSPHLGVMIGFSRGSGFVGHEQEFLRSGISRKVFELSASSCVVADLDLDLGKSKPSAEFRQRKSGIAGTVHSGLK